MHITPQREGTRTSSPPLAGVCTLFPGVLTMQPVARKLANPGDDEQRPQERSPGDDFSMTLRKAYKIRIP